MGALLNLVPMPYRVLGLSLLAAALVGFGWVKGATYVQAEWDAADRAAVAMLDRARVRQAEATVRVVTEYVDRVQVVRTRGADIIKEVPIYVPTNACDLPGGFRLFHDAATRGEPPDPARGLDAPPVAAQAAARTIAENYTACRLNAEQLTGLQEWVRAVRAVAE